MRARRSLSPFQVPIAKPEKVGPEKNPWFWNPSRVGVRGGPGDFERKLSEFDSTLRVTWNPIQEQWQIWAPKPTLQHPICQGWMLLFSVPPRELDERVFARLYQASTRKWADGKKYFDRIEAEITRDREKRQERRRQETRDIASDEWDYSLIKISMAGKSSGSKFANFHSE